MANQEVDLNELDPSLLDYSIDDIADLPSFEVPSDGRYVLEMRAALKKVNDKIGVELGYEVQSCIEKNNDEDKDATAGDKFSQLFFLQGDEESVKISLGMMKRALVPIAEAAGNSNLKYLVGEYLKDGIVVTADVYGKQDKKDPDIRRPVVKNISVA